MKDKILGSKKQDKDTIALEGEIDRLVYELLWMDGGVDRDSSEEFF